MSEVIKHAVIADGDFFSRTKNFTNALIQKSIQIKLDIVAQDEKDHGIRQWLNFGHTIAHAIELHEDYKISHGQAVAMGMIVEAYLSYRLGRLALAEFQEIESMIRQWHPVLKTEAFNDILRFKAYLLSDKKNKNQQVHFVLLNKIGEAHHEGNQYAFPVDKKILDEVLRWAGQTQ